MGRANIESHDRHGRTLVHIACSLGHLDILEFLIECGCNIDATSVTKQTPLMEACIGGHSNIIELLIPEVEDLDATDEIGRSAIHYCALHGEVQCLNVLCDHGMYIYMISLYKLQYRK